MSDSADQKNRRVGERIASSDSKSSMEDIDPALMARLEAWFAGPATGFPPPASEPVRVPPRASRAAPARTTQKAALDAVDPGLLERLESQGARSAAMIEPLTPPESTLDPSIARFDFSVWGLQGIGEEREIERPEDVQFAVQDRTPQALLRDLHRPVRYYGDIYLRPLDLGVDRFGLVSRAAITDLVYGRRYTVNPDREPSGRRAMREGYAELRDILAQPWEQSKPENPRPVPSELPDVNDLKWFGSVGIDPDQ